MNTTTSPHPAQHPLLATGFALLGYSLWVLCDTCTKLSGQNHIPFWQISALSSVVALVVLFATAAFQKRVEALKPRQVKLQLLRALLMCGNSIAGITLFTHLPLATAYAGILACPMLIALLAAFFLKERLSWPQGLAIFLGFTGMFLALQPTAPDLTQETIIGYIALPFTILTFVSSMLMLRFMGRTESREALSFWPFVGRVVAFLPLTLLDFTPMSLEACLIILLLGFCGAMGTLFISMAYKTAQASLVASFHYSQIVVGAIIGYFLWTDVPSWNLVIGGGIIVAAGVYTALHTHHMVVKAR